MVGPEEAKDMLQNVMTKAMTSMPDHKDFKIKPWLYRVARNECIDSMRAAKRCQGGFDFNDVADTSRRHDPQSAAESRERIQQLVKDLGELPEKQRSTLVMRELSGLGYGEIALSIGSSEAGAKQLVYEARLALEQARVGRSMDCAAVREAISSMDGRRLKGRKVRSHLRDCVGCSDFKRSIAERKAGFHSLVPVLPIGAAAGIMDAAAKSGGIGIAAGSGAGAAAGGAVSGAVATGVVAKGLVAVVVAGGLGVGAAEVAKNRDPVPKNDSSIREIKVDPSARVSEGGAGSIVPIAAPVHQTPISAGANPAEEASRERLEPDVSEGVTKIPEGSSDEEADRLTPGSGNGQGPVSLPAQSSKGQERAESASGSKPGLTGNPPPSRKPATPPGQSDAGGSPAAPSQGKPPVDPGKSGSAPAVGKPPVTGKPSK